ncbi:hypothetical protein [Methylibium petroleiphilum]|uniref:Transmembrane protein n=1 Tax=Methylibium petroleiphilum (strain ATCC BAA-1232 / LMG 22953 / PM1) TaxID=420662 RepID=A2SMV9_METPP|nr:hypothetical protein [Methylibium petroleiphilum]ABM96898.1 hypothetical protein Mpe_B0119 [Methylibium petroleiphilum PM1]
MKTFASLTSAAVAALLAAFVGAIAGFFVGFVGVLAFGVTFASLPLFGVGGAALFGLVGAYRGYTRAADSAAVVDPAWAAEDVVTAGSDVFVAPDEPFTPVNHLWQDGSKGE